MAIGKIKGWPTAPEMNFCISGVILVAPILTFTVLECCTFDLKDRRTSDNWRAAGWLVPSFVEFQPLLIPSTSEIVKEFNLSVLPIKL